MKLKSYQIQDTSVIVVDEKELRTAQKKRNLNLNLKVNENKIRKLQQQLDSSVRSIDQAKRMLVRDDNYNLLSIFDLQKSELHLDDLEQSPTNNNVETPYNDETSDVLNMKLLGNFQNQLRTNKEVVNDNQENLSLILRPYMSQELNIKPKPMPLKCQSLCKEQDQQTIDAQMSEEELKEVNKPPIVENELRQVLVQKFTELPMQQSQDQNDYLEQPTFIIQNQTQLISYNSKESKQLNNLAQSVSLDIFYQSNKKSSIQKFEESKSDNLSLYSDMDQQIQDRQETQILDNNENVILQDVQSELFQAPQGNYKDQEQASQAIGDLIPNLGARNDQNSQQNNDQSNPLSLSEFSSSDSSLQEEQFAKMIDLVYLDNYPRKTQINQKNKDQEDFLQSMIENAEKKLIRRNLISDVEFDFLQSVYFQEQSIFPKTTFEKFKEKQLPSIIEYQRKDYISDLEKSYIQKFNEKMLTETPDIYLQKVLLDIEKQKQRIKMKKKVSKIKLFKIGKNIINARDVNLRKCVIIPQENEIQNQLQYTLRGPLSLENLRIIEIQNCVKKKMSKIQIGQIFFQTNTDNSKIQKFLQQSQYIHLVNTDVLEKQLSGIRLSQKEIVFQAKFINFTIDVDILNKNSKDFELKCEKNQNLNKDSEDLAFINDIKYDKTVVLYKILIKIPFKLMDLDKYLNLRIPKLNIKSKPGFMHPQYFKYLEIKMNNMSFQTKWNLIMRSNEAFYDNFLKNCHTAEVIKRPTQWHLHNTSLYCSNNTSIINSMFRMKDQSIYYQLINPDMDLYVFSALQKLLGKLTKDKMVKQGYLKEDDLKKIKFKRSHGKRKNNSWSNEIRMNSQIAAIRQNRVKRQQTLDTFNTAWHSCEDDQDAKNALHHDFKRQGAIDIYNLDKCEFLIFEQIQKYTHKTKEKKNSFTKTLELSRFTEFKLSQQHGFKCKMVRNLNEPGIIYEVFFPTVLQQFRKYQKASKKKKMQSQQKLLNKYIKGQEELETDNSMREINLKDLDSEIETETENTKNTEQVKKGVFLQKAETPLEHYMKMKKYSKQKSKFKNQITKTFKVLTQDQIIQKDEKTSDLWVILKNKIKVHQMTKTNKDDIQNEKIGLLLHLMKNKKYQEDLINQMNDKQYLKDDQIVNMVRKQRQQKVDQIKRIQNEIQNENINEIQNKQQRDESQKIDKLKVSVTQKFHQKIKLQMLMDNYKSDSDLEVENEIRIINQIHIQTKEKLKQQQKKDKLNNLLKINISEFSKSKKQYKKQPDEDNNNIIKKLEEAHSPIVESNIDLQPQIQLSENQHFKNQYSFKLIIKAIINSDLQRLHDLWNRFGGNLSTTIKDEFDMSAVHFAASNTNSAILEFLLEKGQPINYCDDYGNTPLHYAVMTNSKKCQQLLIEKNCNEQIENKAGKIAWQMAV